MTWHATHQSDRGVLSRSSHTEWADASEWLRATMVEAATPAIKLALRCLYGCEPGEAFLFACDGHQYELSSYTRYARKADAQGVANAPR